jgi:hypothetical protein
MLILLIPIQLRLMNLNHVTSIEVELSPKKEVLPQVTVPKQQVKPIVRRVAQSKINKVQPININVKKIVKQTKSLPSSGVIINTFNNRSNYRAIDKDFKVRTKSDDDFIFKKPQKSKIYQVNKLINEEVDKPEVVMNFYSDGIVGSTERVFDKISYKKVFTTRYGTKIYCGGIGPLALCSWK